MLTGSIGALLAQGMEEEEAPGWGFTYTDRQDRRQLQKKGSTEF